MVKLGILAFIAGAFYNGWKLYWKIKKERDAIAAREAGEIARRYWREDPRVWDKGGDDPVSEADFAVDIHLRERLLSARPDYGWVSEETEDDPARLAAAGFAAHLAPAVVECGAWQLVLLSSHVPGAAHGRLGEEQLAWLAGVFDVARDRPVAVFVHHHPLPIASPWMDAMGLADAERFWNVVERFDRTRLVVFGHVHQNVDTYRAGVRVLGTPSTCIQFQPRALRYAADPRRPGYRTLHLRDDGSVATRVVRVALEGQSTARRR